MVTNPLHQIVLQQDEDWSWYWSDGTAGKIHGPFQTLKQALDSIAQHKPGA